MCAVVGMYQLQDVRVRLGAPFQRLRYFVLELWCLDEFGKVRLDENVISSRD